MKKKETLLLIRYGAFGDWIYTCPLVDYLLEKYEVVIECSPKVGLLIYNDPRYKHIECFDWAKAIPKEALADSRRAVVEACGPIFDKRQEYLVDRYKPDKIINLNGSIETASIAESFQEEFFWDVEKRREKYLKDSFYDVIFKRAGVEVPSNLKLDTLYYSSKELEWGLNWREKNKDKFIIMLSIAGSTYPKIFHNFNEYVTRVLEKYPDVIFYITGDEETKKLVPKHERIKDACFNAPIKQVFLMTKFANYVIGPETGVVAAAGMWGTPKTMFCTMSSIDQVSRYQKNDYSIQAPIACSPCVRAVYAKEDCYNLVQNPETQNYYAACSKLFKVDLLIGILNTVRKNYREGKFGPHLPEKYLSKFK